MELKETKIYQNQYPKQIADIFDDCKIYDSSSSAQAKVIFADKDNGYFVKKSRKGSLEKEYLMTNYFYKLGLSCNVLSYISDEFDYLVTPKILGNDCTYSKYLDNPTKLCDTIAQNLAMLHAIKPIDCPIQNHTETYLNTAYQRYKDKSFDKKHYLDIIPYKSEQHSLKIADDAMSFIEKNKHLLKTDTLLHGDYCLPNIILDNWKFSSFIDLGNGGVGDKHVDIFWGIWTLFFNLKTDKYTNRFIDVYGKDKISTDTLRLIAAIEVFG